MLSGFGILTLRNLVYNDFLGNYIESFEFNSTYLNKSLDKCVTLYEFQTSILNKYLSYTDTSIGTFQLMRYDRMYMNTANKTCTFVVTFTIKNQGNTSDLSNYTNTALIRFYNNGRFIGNELSESVQSSPNNNFIINVSSLNLSYSSNYKLYYDYNVHFTSSTTNAKSGTVQPYETITVYHTYLNDKVIIYKHETANSPYSFQNVAPGGLIDLLWVQSTTLTTSERYISIPVLPTSGTVYIDFEIENVLTVNEYNEGGPSSTTSAAAEIGDWDI